MVKTARKHQLRLVGKPRCDSPFDVDGEMKTPKQLIETTTELRQSTQLPDNVAGYQRFYGRHHLLGEGLLVLVEYLQGNNTIHTRAIARVREIIFCTHSAYTGPIVIKLKAIRWLGACESQYCDRTRY